MSAYAARLLLVATIFAGPSAVYGQMRIPSDNDLAAAYCIGVDNARRPEIQKLKSEICDPNDPLTSKEILDQCKKDDINDAEHRNRLIRYLAARGYLYGGSSEELRNLSIIISRGSDDYLQCGQQNASMCGHCQNFQLKEPPPAASNRKALQDYFDKMNAAYKRTSSCFIQCRKTVAACARVDRCREGPFLQSIP